MQQQHPRRGHGRGRGAMRGRGAAHVHAHAPPPPPPFTHPAPTPPMPAPYGGGAYPPMPMPMPMPMSAPPPRPPPPTQHRSSALPKVSERDVTSFVHGLRAQRSNPAAPPNALSLSMALEAITTHFRVGSVEELLGRPPHEVPCLRQLAIQNERVWAFVTCFRHARRIHTLHECHLAFLEHEGVQAFADLGIGNAFGLTDAVQTLYQRPPARFPRLTTHDVLSAFRRFESVLRHDAFAGGSHASSGYANRPNNHVDLAEFLQFLAQQHHAADARALGVHIDPEGFGPYVGLIRRIARKEHKELQALEDEFNRGLAERVFEISKDKFSTESRQRALDALLTQSTGDGHEPQEPEEQQQQQQQEQREPRRKTPTGKKTTSAPSGSSRHSLSSLSVEMLDRVTQVDVYLDNVLRRKSQDAHQRARLAAQQIAETDNKIRQQLTRFLVVAQKSRHFSRIRVITWVLCGVLAKIHALLQLDDCLPTAPDNDNDDEGGAKASATTTAAKTSDRAGTKNEDAEDEDAEECECCCVGQETCRCQCDCVCHRDDDDEAEEVDAKKKTTTTDDDKQQESQQQQQQHAASAPSNERPRGRSRSRSLVAVSEEDVERELAAFFGQRLHESASDDADQSTVQEALELVVAAEKHLQQQLGGLPTTFSLLERVLAALREAHDKGHDDDVPVSASSWWTPIVELLRQAQEASQSSTSTTTMVDDDVLEGFVESCWAQVAAAADGQNDGERAVLHLVHVQFGLAPMDRRLRQCLERVRARHRQEQPDPTTLVPSAPPSTLTSSSSPIVYASLLFPEQCHASSSSSSLALKLALDSPLTDPHEDDERRVHRRREALQAIAQCPVLADVGEWTRWSTAFAPVCGPLLTFLHHHHQAHERILFRGDDHAESTCRFVCCANGRVVRIPEGLTASCLDDAGADAGTMAANLVGLVVEARGLAELPRELVVVHLKTWLRRQRRRMQDGDQQNKADTDAAAGADASEEVDAMLRLVVDCLALVPREFVPGIYELFVAALGPRINVDERLARLACSHHTERRVLQRLGHWLDKPTWGRAMLDDDNNHQRAPVAPDQQQQVTRKTLELATEPAAIANDHSAYITTPLPSAAEAEADAQQALEATDVVESALADPSACEGFITELRRAQFGIGLEISDAATQRVLAIQHRRLERALKRLSDELYSEKTHFVLELLQNADDNAYAPTVVPTTTFTLTRDDAIVFVNNERGFTRANVQAICDVGASTKELRVGGHGTGVGVGRSIGRKGIGFKSVFKVSSTPEVHSNGFHIAFDASGGNGSGSNGGGLGYILPHWIPDPARWRRAPGTTLVLPLNGPSRDRRDEIAASLAAFEPSVLLFLQKIRRLQLENAHSGQRIVFTKDLHELEDRNEATPSDSDDNSVRFRSVTLRTERRHSAPSSGDTTTEAQQQQWIIASMAMAVPESLRSPTRPHTHTEIAIALPNPMANAKRDGNSNDDDDQDDQDDDDQDDQDENANRRPPVHPVFCYLPLRSYGFRFILQADFDVPSSREAVTTGSEWNQWLISRFPALLGAVVDRLGPLGLARGDNFWRLLPLEHEVEAPFRGVVADTLRLLRAKRCFPIADASASGAAKMAPALELLDVSEYAPEDVAWLLARPELVRRALHKHLLAPKVGRALPPLLKSALRLERLRVAHVLRLLAAVAAQHDTASLVPLWRLLRVLWKRGSGSGDGRTTSARLLRQELRLIRCFPLEQAPTATAATAATTASDDLKIETDLKTETETPTASSSSSRWTSLAEARDALFLGPPPPAASELLSPASSVSTTLEVFARDGLQLLALPLTAAMDAADPTLRRFLIDDLGLRACEDHELLAHHVLPQFASLETRDRPRQCRAAWGQYVAFVARHLDQCGGQHHRRAHPRSQSQSQSRCPLTSGIRASVRAWTWSGRYVLVSGTPELFVLTSDVARRLGPEVCEWLRMKHRTMTATTMATPVFDVIDASHEEDDDDDDHVSTQLWREVCDVPGLVDPTDPRATGPLLQIVTWLSASDHVAAQDDARRRRLAMQLATFLDSVWPPHGLSTSASTSAWWAAAPWLPGTDGAFHRPHELWLRPSTAPTTATTSTKAKPTGVDAFATGLVPFCLAPLQSPALLRDWGLTLTPTADDVLGVLRRHRARQGPTADLREATTEDPLGALTGLYAFLAEECDAEDSGDLAKALAGAFAEEQLVLVPTDDDDDGPKAWAFVGVKDVVWSSGDVRIPGRPALDRVFPKSLRGFFVRVCGVARRPPPRALCGALEALDWSTMTLRRWQTRVRPLLEMLARHVVKNKLPSAERKALKRALGVTAPCFPVHRDRKSVNDDDDPDDGDVEFVPVRTLDGVVVMGLDDDDAELVAMWRKLARRVDEHRPSQASASASSPASASALPRVLALPVDALRALGPLLALVGVVGIRESLIQAPVAWCHGLAAVGRSDPGSKRYAKLLRRVLSVWATATDEKEDDAVAEALRQCLAHVALFPATVGGPMTTTATEATTSLRAGPELFLDDQDELDETELLAATAAAGLPLLALFRRHRRQKHQHQQRQQHGPSPSSSSFIDEPVPRALRRFLLDVARVRSLQAELRPEVLSPGGVDARGELPGGLRTRLWRGLGVLQRVVAHLHPQTYGHLPHADIATTLQSLEVRVAAPGGGGRGLEAIYRVPGTALAWRKAVTCCLQQEPTTTSMVLYVQGPGGDPSGDDAAQRGDESVVLFEALRALCRGLLGPALATGVANVAFLAALQPTAADVERWLGVTQRIPPVDAAQGTGIEWLPPSDVASKRPRVAEEEEEEEEERKKAMEDGEIPEEEEEVHNNKRLRTEGSSYPPPTWSHVRPPPSAAPHHHQQQQPGGGGLYGARPPSAYGAAAGAPLPPPGLSHFVNVGPGSRLSEEERLAIGRWGEEHVYQQLRALHAGDDAVEVTWVNEHEESGLPYDVVVATGASRDVEYIEVKSTRTMEKGVFEISMNELDHAAVHGSRFSIYRVFNAGNAASCRVVRMKNPIALVRQKKIQLLLVMQ